MLEQFEQEVKEGLSQQPKQLSSKYFYDEKGDQLFVQIMHLPEYYLTRSELEIFQTQFRQIVNGFGQTPATYFELIELGAGDGLKTRELLKELLRKDYHFSYVPVDISSHALENLTINLKKEFPDLQVQPQQGEYFEVLESIRTNQHPKVVLFLGSNIGNLPDEKATRFINRLGSNLGAEDRLLLGVDLIKSASVVLPAYNDSEGVTKAFNLNLLDRMNRELGANFDASAFDHAPEYSEEEGVARSFIKSLKDQTVYFSSMDTSFEFNKGEKIHTEISRKYSDEVLTQILKDTDFAITEKFLDRQRYFADYLLVRE